ncbi:hypothetical protein N7466_010063 [Penicillium verhagenii]|uniref:uncharacterized protein n=1 Tax=Penicillium verhagenii TaxID=1562060 RepID=UPI0025451D6C|nr:uncharacterized protein N7466_010063 [Penicillium verhagenii]KAJ5919120.1 hypothetical protein N7466_010063 [Penicillium verhagenii]
MLKMLEQANDVSHNTQEENWTLLQGLAVLYSYPRVSAVSVQGPERKLSLWAVKSAVETCAMQLSLHHSVEDLQVYLQSPGPEILASLPYRRSFYWIWLFVKSRHHSVITRTPPTIRNDSTISAILEIMPHFDSQPGVRRVLAEAALHHQWDKAARPDTDLAEWWCVPRCTKDIGALSELLDNADNLLQEWGAIWLQPYDLSVPSSHGSSLEDPLVFANSITAFMGVLTRFSIVSFAAPIVSHQLMAKTGLATFPPSTAHSPELSAFLNCVLKSADAASKCCDAIIELKPASRDALRYMPDYGFTMIALCCLHLVYAYNMCPDNSTLRSHLSKVEQVAELMIDLSFGCNICPKVYGENILSKLRAATRSSVQSTDNVDQSHSMATSPIGPTVGLPGPHAWSQVGSVAGFDYPMDSLFRVSSSNADWPPTELSSDILLQSNSGLVDLFNTYPESVLYSNTSSL